MSKCQDEKNDYINFGDATSDSVCWYIESRTSHDVVLGEETNYTDLFQKMWKNVKGNWGDATNYWKSQCKTGKKWSFKTSVGGIEYLSSCSEDQYPIQWLVIKNKNSGKPDIEVCSKDCFISQIEHGWKWFTTRSTQGLWKDVKFYKNSKSN